MPPERTSKDPKPSLENELEKLRHQRALIAEHLSWLDARIREAEAAGFPKPEAKSPPPKPPALPRTVPEQASGATANKQHLPQLQAPEYALKTHESLQLPDLEEARLAGRRNARSIQAGCLVMALLAVLSVVVFFFVVPYFIF